MDPDLPLYAQLIFVYDKALKFNAELIRSKHDPHPVCISCKCRIIKSTWSPQVKETRCVAQANSEYEIPFVDVIYYE